MATCSWGCVPLLSPADAFRHRPNRPRGGRARCPWSGRRRSLLKVLDRCTHFGRVPLRPDVAVGQAVHAGPPAENNGRHLPPPPLDANHIGRTTPGTSWWFRPTAARRLDRHRHSGLHSASTPHRCATGRATRCGDTQRTTSVTRTPGQHASSALCHAAPSAVSSLRALGSIRISGRAVQRTKLLTDRPDPGLGCLFRLETGTPHAEPHDHQSPSGPFPRHIVSRRPSVPVAPLFDPAPSRAEGGEEHRTDHRIAAGREQRLAAQPDGVYLPDDPLQIVPLVDQPGRLSGRQPRRGVPTAPVVPDRVERHVLRVDFQLRFDAGYSANGGGTGCAGPRLIGSFSSSPGVK